jgi:hypothetical protein
MLKKAKSFRDDVKNKLKRRPSSSASDHSMTEIREHGFSRNNPCHSRATTLKQVHETHIFFLQQSPRSINEPLMSLRSINEPLTCMSLSSSFLYVPMCFRLSCYSWTTTLKHVHKNSPLLLTHCFVG